MKQTYLILLIGCFFIQCKTEEPKKDIFELKDNASIGLNFENKLNETSAFNVYKYRNFYNGGGVGIGDINNDNLVDVYMVSNQNENKLFLNKGNWQFEDITQKAGVGGQRAWSTGVSMADVNGDGFVDIYVCNSGDVQGDNKENELFINNGDLTFTESAAEYGLNDAGFSTHASFFDYDKDGDLDVYILNNSFQAIGSFNLKKNERPVRDALGGDKLMENQNGKFVDVSEKAGIYGSVIGFGLGITVGDVNNDGWEDIYISNDFFERDYLYINQKNGTFREELTEQMMSISGASMGADIADINNDGYCDIFVTEMLPSDYQRLKTVTTFEDWDRYEYGVNNGYYHQYTRNTLQLNNGNNTFSEISRFAGVDASDWSWGALFFDMDNDGNKDLFIANGIYRDLTNQDYLQYIANESFMKSVMKDEGVDYKKLIEIIPSNPIPNHSYKNNGEGNFAPFMNSGLGTPGFSNGSAYADLDNDGDLDLIVNNVNMPSFVYENKANELVKNSYLKIDLKGLNKNSKGVGARMTATDGKQTWTYESQPTRGFQSCMDSRINMGLGNATTVDIKVTWSSGKVSELKSVKVNQQITIEEKDAQNVDKSPKIASLVTTLLSEVLMDYTHVENAYVDFNRERLNYHMMSTQGPKVGIGDINGDGLTDLIIPGPKGIATKVLLKTKDGKFVDGPESPIFETIKEAEHIKCHLFDADKDGDLDLYMASGGVELTEYSEYLFDEVLLNDGKGVFSSTGQRLPSASTNISTGAVATADIDNDGDLDIFVGERVKIGQYGASCSGYILVNDGKGIFKDLTESRCKALQGIGMITDATFSDLDKDGFADLVVVGEFMELSIFKNRGGNFEKIKLDDHTNGWWNVVKAVDIDNDGDLDLVMGNHGLNSRFKADATYPINLYYSDFDENGSPEGILTKVHADKKGYPYALRHNLMMRLPSLKKKYANFESFKTASIDSIFTPQQLANTSILEVNELSSCIMVNEGNLKFKKVLLPYQVQFSPIYAIETLDMNGDGFADLLMGGNLYGVQPEVGRYDASYGHILINDGKGMFRDRSKEYGFSVKGQIRDFVVDNDFFHVFRNNDSVLSFKLSK
jgi:enediyne biosynthesis protein E4